jgi:EAL domain-containing protein (putative c-di-GMP-specific phosphodiesterase class I)/ActR/RegA family two-component response regulator
MNYKTKDKKKVLVIDDDPSVVRMLSLLLETRGYEVDVAHSGAEGLNKVSRTTDLILLDLVLPDQDGFDVCRKLKEGRESKYTPIIILSAKIQSRDIVEGLYLGAEDYLTKPFEYEELVARMETVMRRCSIFYSGKADNQGEEKIIRELKKIINEERIVPFFQPIFKLHPFELLGFEALTRPKTDSVLANPELLFKAAIQFGVYSELEILSWKKAVQYANQFLDDKKLFLNCNPYLVECPKFLTIKSIFDNINLKINNVVLEITERSSVSDFKVFYEHLDCYKQHGFSFAVDDVGGGFASLEAIVETKPEVLKIDRHIINAIYDDAFKRSIVKFIVSFCKENQILSIAEGIESQQELDIVRELGIDAGQGYYLAKPSPSIDNDHISQVIQSNQ